MDQIERRVRDILSSPIGCEFLQSIETVGLAPEAAATPRYSFCLAAQAVECMTVWDPRHDDLVADALGHAGQLAPLARRLIEHPGASWWFEPLDLERQVWVEHGREPFGVEPLDAPLDTTKWTRPRTPPDEWERYAQKPRGLQYTSTLAGSDSSLLVGYDKGVGDLITGFPAKCWELQISANVRVYEIHGPGDWNRLCARYPARGFEGVRDAEWLVPDWGAAAGDWDGVHLSLGGLLTAEQVRYESSPGWSELDFWHAERTFWLGPIEASARRLPDRERGECP